MHSNTEWTPWTEEQRLKIGEEIYKKHNYGKILWTCGLIKTATSSALFTIGVTLIFYGLTNHPMFRGWDEVGIFFGVIAICLGFLVIYVIDKRRETMKKEEYGKTEEEIERKLYEAKIAQDEEIKLLAQQVADERVHQALRDELKRVRYEDCNGTEKEFKKDMTE